MKIFIYENAHDLKLYEENDYIAACIYFRDNVMDGDKLDIERKIDWRFEDSVIYLQRQRTSICDPRDNCMAKWDYSLNKE